MKKRSRLIKALDNRFYVKFMQLEIGLFKGFDIWYVIPESSLYQGFILQDFNFIWLDFQNTGQNLRAEQELVFQIQHLEDKNQ